MACASQIPSDTLSRVIFELVRHLGVMPPLCVLIRIPVKFASHLVTVDCRAMHHG